MQTFHNDQAVKDKYLARVEAHIAADNLMRGRGWEDGKGCAIGCTLEAYDHASYPIELGIPEWLARLEDTLFEGMSKEKSRSWPKDFLVSMPLGVPESDLERRVKGPFLLAVLTSALGTFDHAQFPEVAAAIKGSMALRMRSDIGSKEFIAAAASAAWAARAAKYDQFADTLLELLASCVEAKEVATCLARSLGSSSLCI